MSCEARVPSRLVTSRPAGLPEPMAGSGSTAAVARATAVASAGRDGDDDPVRAGREIGRVPRAVDLEPRRDHAGVLRVQLDRAAVEAVVREEAELLVVEP